MFELVSYIRNFGDNVSTLKLCPASSLEACTSMSVPKNSECFLVPVFSDESKIDCNRNDKSPITVFYRDNVLKYTDFSELRSEILDDDMSNKGEYLFIIQPDDDSTLSVKARFEDGRVVSAVTDKGQLLKVSEEIDPSSPSTTGITFAPDGDSSSTLTSPVFVKIPFCDAPEEEFTLNSICVDDFAKDSFHVVVSAPDCDNDVESEDEFDLKFKQCIQMGDAFVVPFMEHDGGDVPVPQDEEDSETTEEDQDDENDSKPRKGLVNPWAVLAGVAAGVIVVVGLKAYMTHKQQKDALIRV